jgi:hypothetical protein
MQTIETPEVFHFDGVAVESEEIDADDLRLRLGAYGGVPVHFYESSASGDVIYGGYAAAHPWRGGQIRLDAAHIEDEADGVEEEDDLLGISLEHRISPMVGLWLRHTRLDGASRDIEARVDGAAPSIGLSAQLFWYDQPTTRRDATPELDPFSDALHDLAPHQLFGGVAHQGIGEHVTLSAGYHERILADQSDESDFNHEYSRAFATFAWEDWPWEGTAGFVTGDDWDSTGDDARTASGEIGQELGKTLRASVGSSYALYEYDYLLQEERDDVRTVYLRLDAPLEGPTRFRLELEYERDPFDEYTVVSVRWTQDF